MRLPASIVALAASAAAVTAAEEISAAAAAPAAAEPAVVMMVTAMMMAVGLGLLRRLVEEEEVDEEADAACRGNPEEAKESIDEDVDNRGIRRVRCGLTGLLAHGVQRLPRVTGCFGRQYLVGLHDTGIVVILFEVRRELFIADLSGPAVRHGAFMAIADLDAQLARVLADEQQHAVVLVLVPDAPAAEQLIGIVRDGTVIQGPDGDDGDLGGRFFVELVSDGKDAVFGFLGKQACIVLHVDVLRWPVRDCCPGRSCGQQ